MIEIYYSPHFQKMYKRLPAGIKALAEKKEEIFRRNPFHPQLRTHKLTGKLKDYWAFSMSHQHRIIFSFVTDHKVHFHAIWTHSIYER